MNLPIQHVPDSAWQLSRRELVRRVVGAMTAAAVFPRLAAATPDGESFWRVVKEQFPLRPGLILLNAANLCPSPYPVLETVFGLTRDIDADASFQNRDKFDELRETSRRALTTYMGADPEEVAMVRNTTEANNMVINGVTLGPGDEVVLWDQNHPTNNLAWDVRAARYGFTVKRVKTPPAPENAQDLIRPFEEALTNQARVLALTHVSNTTGVALPIQELCRIARQRGILSLVDGAQTFGALDVNLHDLGCDFYTGSAHKWLVGPKEAGLLYVRRERIEGLWPSVVGSGWEEARKKGARKFEALGQRDDAAVAAMGRAVEFHNTIGKARVEARVRQLASTLKKAIAEIPGARLHTPVTPERSAGVVVFTLPGVDPNQGFETLYRQYHVAGASLGGAFPGIRLCPHIYNTLEQMERVIDILRSLKKS